MASKGPKSARRGGVGTKPALESHSLGVGALMGAHTKAAAPTCAQDRGTLFGSEKPKTGPGLFCEACGAVPPAGKENRLGFTASLPG